MLHKLKIHGRVYHNQENFIFAVVVVGLRPPANLFFALFYAQCVQHLCTTVLTVYQMCVFETSEICHMAAFTYQS